MSDNRKSNSSRGTNYMRGARVFFVILFSFVAVFVIWYSCFAGATVVVNGDSMEPLFHDGDLLVLDEVSSVEDLPLDNPVCWVTLPDGSNVIKRLIGYPGDTIHLIDGDTYRNGELLMSRTTNSWDNIEFSLGEDEYLFLGDNRANSLDGREWAGNYVGFSSIRGVVPDSGLSG